MLRPFNKASGPIEFLCREEDWGIIPEPYRAGKSTPDWYKKLPGRIGEREVLRNATIKRCAPFIDAMSIGWIIPLAADVQIVSANNDEDAANSGLSSITWNTLCASPMIEAHTIPQVSTVEAPNPRNPRPPLKWMNYWAIRAAPGWSVLFVPPLNRVDPRFEVLSGLVDCDGYFAYVNFPFYWLAPHTTTIVQQGTPIVQAIPIKRSTLQRSAPVRTFTAKELADLNKTRAKLEAHESFYRDKVWTKK